MSQLAQNAAGLLLRELGTLRREVEAYPDDTSIWAQPESLPNSTGTLTLHLCGNVRFFVGGRLGNSGYVRDRPREFSARGVPRSELLQEITEAETAVRLGLPGLTEAQLAARFPDAVLGHTLETGDFVMHLCSHFAYHLGQIDYHRRMVTGRSTGVDAVPPSGLRTAVPSV